MKIYRYLILTLIVVSMSACIQLGESVVPSQYYVLESMTTTNQSYPDKHVTITVELTEFPDYLKRPQIVQQQQNVIYFTDTKRWATALEEQLLSLITSNLGLLLPQATIYINPWQSKRHTDHSLQLSVKKLSGVLGQQTDIDIRWKTVDKHGEQRRGKFIDQRPINDSYEEFVGSLNRGLEELSNILAQELAKP
ncbi:PqiC family protein [Pelovirga terrestris]|uniref:Membrane integrity-associated transporter subunit PqiC n=1 Tax=Pelovirga terrestris TaxID=2771352 RepID=A0A8J6R4G9_9BACT|nr:ABC-type transport auxiliary lipoprotein family protein [Pelovirga terrestris]MBD1399144.1 membrane integrity-associated transporter subunit PqiC [Pelovirga terrestris]